MIVSAAGGTELNDPTTHGLLATPGAEDDARESEDFHRLQARLRGVWEAIESGRPFDHTSVVVPSLSFHPEELTKISGVPFYEERLLFSLIRLRHPRARVVYLSSQPIHPDIVDYYLQHLVGVPASHARGRLEMLCAYDASPRPLSQKVLERPRLLERIRRSIGDVERGYLTCFNSTPLERRLAIELGVPLNGVDPDLLHLGTKSGCRKIFRDAGVDLPAGTEDVRSERQVVDTLLALSRERPGLRHAVVKLNESFAGAGNALFAFPDSLPADDGPRREAIAGALRRLEFSAEETYDDYLRKLSEMGGIVEEFVEAAEVRSPSVQMRINPDGGVELISTHDQVLGGPTGQTYVGCRFPADDAYRELIMGQAMKIGRALAARGVISRFAIDFMLLRDSASEPWRPAAIEINLRMGGTTPPFLGLQFLTGGRLEPQSGLFLSRGKAKYYYATDVLKSDAYRGLLPEDFIDILTLNGLRFEPATETGVLFHMIGALSEFGKVGVTCIGDSRDQADELFRRTAEILDRETAAAGARRPEALFDRGFGRME